MTESQLRELVEALPHLVWTCLAEGPCDYLSRQWVEYTGIAETEQMGYGWLLQLHPDDRERVKAEWGAAVGNGLAFDIEFRIRRADGFHRWFRTRAIPLRDPSGTIVKWFGSSADIDDYRTTEESVRLSEERFRQAITRAPVPMIIHDENDTILAMSEGWTRVSEYTMDDIPTFGAWTARAFGERRALAKDSIDKLFATDATVSDGESTIRTKSGFERVWEVFTTPLRQTRAGAHRWLLTIAVDHTERKREEADLAATLESIGDALIATDAQGYIVRMNPVAVRLTGWTAADARGCPLRDVFRIIHEVTRQPVESPADRVLREGVVVGLANHTVLLAKDGVERPIMDSGSPIRDRSGNVTGVVLVFHDMTDERATRLKLGQSEQRFRRLFESGILGILVADVMGNILDANEAFLSMFGYTSDDLRAGRIRWNEMTPREWQACDARAVEELGSTGVVRSFEKEYFRKDGSVVPIALGAATIEGTDECICFVLDLTERKRAEHAIEVLTAELEQRVASRTAELDVANRELEAFSYSVAHDLRAPLRGMSGFARLLMEDHAATLDADALDALLEIQANAFKMSELIDAMLALSRLTRSEMKPEHLDFTALVREVANAQAAAEPERDVEVVVEDGMACVCDPPLARALLENLLGNAWKFTKHVARPRVEVGRDAAHDVADATAFFVRDNGAGFDLAYVDKLFAPFQRLHSTSEYPGTGVGLATVQRIIHRHAGRIWADGRVGAGATFHFTMPSTHRGVT